MLYLIKKTPATAATVPGNGRTVKEFDMADRTCTIDGCGRPHLARGWCGTHYKRWRTTGDPGDDTVRAVVRRPGTLCAVDGCARPRTQRDWCNAHYARWRRHGDVGSAELLDRSAPRACSVDGCVTPHDSNGYCAAHAHRMRRYGDPTGSPDPRPRQGDPAGWRTDDVGYMGAHNRTRRMRGKASSYQCAECGSQAADWAYDHSDPHERHEEVGGYLVAYSVSPDHYFPLCKTCHVHFDKRSA